MKNFLEKVQKKGQTGRKRSNGKGNRTKQKNKRGDSKVESNDSPDIPDRGGGGEEKSEDFTVTNYVKSSQEFVPLLDGVSFPTQLLKVTARVHHTEQRLTGSRCRT